MRLCAWNIQCWFHSRHRDTYAVLLPNYTPNKWHECDMFGVTRAGFFHEFEIKISVSDFRADAKKRQSARYDYEAQSAKWIRTPGRKKHERLAIGDIQGPSRFSYIVPSGMISLADVPDWAGLIIVNPADDRHWSRFETEKTAPKLHEKKVGRTVLRHAMNVCYYRFWDERHELERLIRA